MSRVFGYSGREYCCYFYFVSWFQVSLGISIDIKSPNLEIHIPFGFFKVGKEWKNHMPFGILEESK